MASSPLSLQRCRTAAQALSSFCRRRRRHRHRCIHPRYITSASRVAAQEDEQEHLVVTERRALVPTNFSKTATGRNGSLSATTRQIPLALNDAFMLNEQLPYAYFFRERLCDEELQSSLEKVLADFPVLGGRLCLDSLSIVLGENDAVPYSVGSTRLSADEWMRMRHGVSPETGRPSVLPLFDPLLPDDPWNAARPLSTVRVTHIVDDDSRDGDDGSFGGTIIGVNCSHAVGDAASCVHFAYCWGRSHRDLAYPVPCPDHNRAMVTTNGMLTVDHRDLLNLGSPPAPLRRTENEGQNRNQHRRPSRVSSFSSRVLAYSRALLLGKDCDSGVLGECNDDDDVSTRTAPVEHEFVLLRFERSLLEAMKSYGSDLSSQLAEREAAIAVGAGAGAVGPGFVSTNDLVTAAGWVLMMRLSGRHDWGMNILVNLRGRADDCPDFNLDGDGAALFGNGITAATATLPPFKKNHGPETSPSSSNLKATRDEERRRHLVASARACRAALAKCLDKLPDRLAASRAGKPVQRPAPAAFCTTTWHFPLWRIGFEERFPPSSGPCPDGGQAAAAALESGEAPTFDGVVDRGRLFAFHGQPVHPLPAGETYSAVVVPTASGGLDYQLFLPRHHAAEAREFLRQLNKLFVDDVGS